VGTVKCSSIYVWVFRTIYFMCILRILYFLSFLTKLSYTLCNVYMYNIYKYDVFPLFYFHIYICFESLKSSDFIKVLHTHTHFLYKSLSFNLHPSTDPFISFNPLGIIWRFEKQEFRNSIFFWDRQKPQDIRFSDVSGTNRFPIFSVCWWFGSTKTDD
jgi:hypothetical protein